MASSTQQFVDIAAIKDKLVLLKDGSIRAIIRVTAINFELRSEGEQTAIIQNFQNFLNSLDFPIQIVINSRQLNIDDYVKTVESATENIDNELIKIQAEEYSKFIKEISTLANVMSKRFYVVVPFYVYEAPTKTGIISSFKSILKPSSEIVTKVDEQTLETYQNQILQRAELVFDGLLGLGLKTELLVEEELKNIFYEMYNQGAKIDFGSVPAENQTTQ